MNIIYSKFIFALLHLRDYSSLDAFLSQEDPYRALEKHQLLDSIQQDVNNYNLSLCSNIHICKKRLDECTYIQYHICMQGNMDMFQQDEYTHNLHLFIVANFYILFFSQFVLDFLLLLFFLCQHLFYFLCYLYQDLILAYHY